jgi:TatD DNase family protein
MYSESHCHLGAIKLEAIKKAENQGFELLLTSGIDLISSELAVKTAEKYDIVKACIGIHPWYADEYNDEIGCLFKDLGKNPEVVAISEIGLDFVGRMTKEWVREERFIDKEIQRKTIRSHIELAKEMRLPVIVHDRAQGQEILDVIEEMDAIKLGVAIHGFNKDADFVKRASELGLYLSIGLRSIQNLTPEFQEAIKAIPLNRILTETDSDKPEGVLQVCDGIARIRGLRREEIGTKATSNLRTLLKF